MATKSGYLVPLAAALAVSAAVIVAPGAAATPKCTATGPTTTQCQTPGHAQITTSPPVTNYSPWLGFPYGGIGIPVIGIGIG